MEGKISKLDIGLTATTRRLDHIELAVHTGEVSAEAAQRFGKFQQQVLELRECETSFQFSKKIKPRTKLYTLPSEPQPDRKRTKQALMPE